LGIQGSLKAATHHLLLFLIQAAINFPIKDSGATSKVSAFLVVKDIGLTRNAIQIIPISLAKEPDDHSFISRLAVLAGVGVDLD